jgi:hypothetical protein
LRNFSKFFVHLLHRIPSVGMLWTALN